MSINYRSLKIEHRKLIGLLLFFFFVLLFLPLAAQEKLVVDGNLTVKSADSGAARYGLVLTPQNATPSAQEGQIYYNDANNVNQPRYYDGANWKNLAGDDKYVATRVVAASDSLDTTCADGVCSNPRADYTCDGTNDQHEINQAINSLPVAGGASYGVVYLLEGTYNISATVSQGETLAGIIPHSNTAIIGTGRGTVLKVKLNESNVNVINAQNVQKILISQLMIDGNSKTGSLNEGINFSSVTYSKIDKVWVENMRNNGIYLSSSSNNIISNNNIQSNGFYGIGFLSNSNNNIISGNNIQSNQYHSIYIDSSFNTISNNNIQSNQGGSGDAAGICLYQSSSPYINNNIISNNNIQSNVYGIYLMSGSYSTISNNNIQLNTNYGILLASGNSNTISGNNIQGNYYDGIYISSGNNSNIITANIIYDNGTSGAYSGIFSGSSNNIISFNRISDTAGAGYGINLSGSNNYLIGNLIDGAGYDAGHLIQDLGTGTKYTDKLKITLERVVVVPTDGNPLDVSTSPQGYIALNPSGAVTLNATTAISDGKAAGDILILEGNSTNTVKIPNGANTVLIPNDSDPVPNKKLGLEDVLTLLYNGTDWLEMGWADN